MRGQQIALLGLTLGLVALLSPLGLYILRLGMVPAMAWVFGIWAGLVLMAALARRASQSGQKDHEDKPS